MDKACLVIFLSESLLVPSSALQEYIHWEEIDDTHAKAIIKHYGINASGLFTFSEDGEMLSFTTEDKSNNSGWQSEWSVICGNYKKKMLLCTQQYFKQYGNYDEGDLVYFTGNNIKFSMVNNILHTFV